jgi:hypothetical protein
MLRVEVRVRGVIDKSWSDWFEGLVIEETSPDETTLHGHLSDQAALYGLLAKLRDLGFQLASVQTDDHAK